MANRLGFSSPGSVATIFDNVFGLQVASGTVDAITIKEGVVFVTSSGVNAMTLATPVAGADDGKRLTIKSTTAHAHTVTTAANVINGADDTITFGGAVTDYSELVAYNAKWWQGPNSGSTLSEV
jgi:hypothetical protein